MNKGINYEFCMKKFKPAIGGLTLLLVIILAWTTWHCTKSPRYGSFRLAAAHAAPAPPIGVKDKMLHPYWGNCNKCHVTTNAGKPVSKVMAAAPISIKQTMPHKYWGNCLMCHAVTDGFQAPGKTPARQRMQAAAFQQITSAGVGLKLQSVTAAVMQQFALANEDGVLVLAVTPGSPAARAGLQAGDEIIRAGRLRLDTVNDFETALNNAKADDTVKLKLYRGTRARNLLLRMPAALQQAATQAPMTQNQVETLAEQLGVPKTPQAVNQALARQQQARAAATVNQGKVAVAATGPGLGYAVAHQFDTSSYFVIYDPVQNAYRVVANPNANDLTGHGVQSGQFMVDSQVANVVAGNFSPEAIQTLHTLRVNAYAGVTGTVQSALNAYRAHGLRPVGGYPTAAAPVASVPGYYPPGGGVNTPFSTPPAAVAY